MIDLASAECIIRAAHRCVEVMAERIAADPNSPLVPELQLIADHAKYIITATERGA